MIQRALVRKLGSSPSRSGAGFGVECIECDLERAGGREVSNPNRQGQWISFENTWTVAASHRSEALVGISSQQKHYML